MLRAWLAQLTLAAALTLPGGVGAAEVCTNGTGPLIERVCYTDADPGIVYGHSILGPTPEWSDLVMHFRSTAPRAITGGRPSAALRLEEEIWEDVAPRLVQLDDDPFLEIIAVQSGFGTGARLFVLDPGADGIKAVAGDWIGRTNRWLAPVGAADFDGDGHVEIAYVDRPHLAKTLRIVRFKDGALTPVAALTGVTNHRIGEPDIGGGVRTCAGRPEMVVARGDWQQVMVALLENGEIMAREIGAHTGRGSLNAALKCQ